MQELHLCSPPLKPGLQMRLLEAFDLDHRDLRGRLSDENAHRYLTCVTLFSFTPRITGRNQHRLPAGL